MPPEINHEGIFIGFFYTSLGLLFLIFLIYFFNKIRCKIFGHRLKNRDESFFFWECEHCDYHEVDEKYAQIVGSEKAFQKWLDGKITAEEYCEVMKVLYPNGLKNSEK